MIRSERVECEMFNKVKEFDNGTTFGDNQS